MSTDTEMMKIIIQRVVLGVFPFVEPHPCEFHDGAYGYGECYEGVDSGKTQNPVEGLMVGCECKRNKAQEHHRRDNVGTFQQCFLRQEFETHILVLQAYYLAGYIKGCFAKRYAD